MPETAEDIETVAANLDKVDYNMSLSSLAEAKLALENSIKQYNLVDAPNEKYVIKCLGNVKHIVDISAVTKDNDPNGNLDKPGGYTAQVYFSCDLVNQNSIDGKSVIEKGTACGGSIEVYGTPEEANKRRDYLSIYDGTILASGTHTVIGTVLIRISNELKAFEQKKMEKSIIKALTALE